MEFVSDFILFFFIYSFVFRRYRIPHNGEKKVKFVQQLLQQRIFFVHQTKRK